jgi:serine/threonine protein phosphatase PrpC
MRVFSYSIQGKRDSNEDQHFISTNLDNSNIELNSINFLSVFDGHGGKLVSKFLKEKLPDYFIKKFKKNIFTKPEFFSKYINKVYNLLQDKLKQDHPRAANYCGSTSCITIHFKNKEDKQYYLWILNVGDSRSVLSNKDGLAVQLSKDHKPNSPDEKKRIEKLGGSIVFDGVDWRVKDLSLSRAFGDIECTPYVTHLPEIYRYKLSNDDKFIILACDGLWDVLNNQDAIDYIQNLENEKYKGNYAKALCEYAYKMGSLDNITIIIYFLNKKNC